MAAKPTGVQRVAYHLLVEINKHEDMIRLLFPEGMRIHSPRNGKTGGDLGRLSLLSHSRLVGHSWEQLELPLHARGNLLLNLCNLAPVFAKNAITMIHDAQVYTTPGSYSRAFRQWYRFVLPLIGARNLQILTVSHFSAKQLVEFGVAPANRITVIHNGVDHVLNFGQDELINAKYQLEDRGYVLALASTHRHKNIDLLLRAFSDQRLRGMRLVLIGAVGADEFARHSLRIPPNVSFVGKVSDDQMRVLMERALCFAMPSLTEGFGLPPLEAMMLGCPALLAPCGALPEVAGDAALYADPNDPDAWIDGILRLKEDPALRERLVATGRAWSARFTWESAGIKLVETLRRFAAIRRRL